MNPMKYTTAEENQALRSSLAFWSTPAGDLIRPDQSRIAEGDLPLQLQHALHELWFDGTFASQCRLVQTDQGYGIALINEYDKCFANDIGMGMEELFKSAVSDCEVLAACAEFEAAAIHLTKGCETDESHTVIVVFPADTPKEHFYRAAQMLDNTLYQSANAAASNKAAH